MIGRRRAGLIGAAAGLVAVGAAAGLAGERYTVGRNRLRPDPHAREPFGSLRGRPRAVVADDGVVLHVEEVGAADAPMTVIFTHGFSLQMASWHYQWRDLSAANAPGKLVFWDHRGHGRSGTTSDEHATIEWLGRDLLRVMDEVAPTGPVVLVGHSMGGMTIMALADQRPDLFGSRVFGVGLVGTSSGKVADTLLRVPAALSGPFHDAAPRIAAVLARQATMVDRGRRLGTDLGYVMTRRHAFGSDPGPALIDFVDRMISSTPTEVIAQFLPTFVQHDKLRALSAFDGIETTVVVGDRDRMTPIDHSRQIVGALPYADFVVVPSAGHMVMLERPSLVNLHLRQLCKRAARAASDAAISTA